MSFEGQRALSVFTVSDHADEDISPGTNHDWSFASLKPNETLWGPHGYHRYPAKFIPQLVRRIIDTYSCPGDLVGDTFVGSATTGIEALRSGRRFWGSDINPVALLIGCAKCTPLLPEALNTAWKQLSKRLKHVQRVGRRPLSEKEKEVISAIDVAHASDEERFAYWFPAAYQSALESILHEILLIGDEPFRIFVSLWVLQYFATLFYLAQWKYKATERSHEIPLRSCRGIPQTNAGYDQTECTLLG